MAASIARMEPAFTGESDAAPTAARGVRQPKQHVMRVARTALTGKTRPVRPSHDGPASQPETVHAIDAAEELGRRPGEREVVPDAALFSGGPINSGPLVACGYVKVRVAPWRRDRAG